VDGQVFSICVNSGAFIKVMNVYRLKIALATESGVVQKGVQVVRVENLNIEDLLNMNK